MTAIMRSMSVAGAAAVLEQKHLTNPVLAQATSMALAGTSHLRKQPKGYSG